MFVVVGHMLRKRRLSLLWWSISIALLVGLLAVAYPTVRDNHELDKTFADLPQGVRQLLGIHGDSGVTSPAGYLNSQFFANLLPAMMLVFAVSIAAWAVSGDEGAGTLELLLANPVSRVRVVLERAFGLVLLLAALSTICAATLILLAKPTGLNTGLSASRIVAATIGSACLALVFASAALTVGAATGSRPAALAVAAGLAVTGYVVEGLADQVPALRNVQHPNPWHWHIAGNPLLQGLSLRSWLLPLSVSAVLVAVGIAGFARRDLR